MPIAACLELRPEGEVAGVGIMLLSPIRTRLPDALRAGTFFFGGILKSVQDDGVMFSATNPRMVEDVG